MNITWHGVHKNWGILHATKNDNFLRKENRNHIIYRYYSSLIQGKHYSLETYFDPKGGISLILFHNIGKLVLPIFIFNFEKKALGKSPWDNEGDLLICHFSGLKPS